MESFINFLYNLSGGYIATKDIKSSITLKKEYLMADGKFEKILIDEYTEDLLSQIEKKLKDEDGNLPNNLKLLIGENNTMKDEMGLAYTSKIEFEKFIDFIMEFEDLEKIQPKNLDLLCIGPNFEILKKYFSGCFDLIVINLCKIHLIPDLNMYVANCIDLLKLGGRLLIDGNNYKSFPRNTTDVNSQYESAITVDKINFLKKNASGKYILNIGKSDKFKTGIYSSYKYPSKILEIQKKSIEYNSENKLVVKIINNTTEEYLSSYSKDDFSCNNFSYFECTKRIKVDPIKILPDHKVLINGEYLIDLNKHKIAPSEPSLDELNKFRFVHKKEKAF